MRSPRRLVVVFLRGGADGLALVPPVSDPAYYDARPTIAVPEPGAQSGALRLDDTFGLHPALGALEPLYRRGELAVVHATGSDDRTRSHFDAQDRMERASTGADGWLARHLRSRPGNPPGALSGVTIGPSLPLALQGGPAAALSSLDDAVLEVPGPFRDALNALWVGDQDVVTAGARALAAADRVAELADATVTGLPESPFGRALADVVRLARADVGLEAVHLDFGNWDTHFVQTVVLDGLARDLAEGLAGLPAALGAAWSTTTVLVMTEFGRRIYENTSLGTDHGRGSVAFVLGGDVRGGRVITDWPGLSPSDLDARDLPVTLDYREILAEAVLWAGNPHLDQVLPGFEPQGLGLFPTGK